MKVLRIFSLFYICFFVCSVNLKAQLNIIPSPGQNGKQKFYFNKPDSFNFKTPFIFSTPIAQIHPGIEQSQFHFDLLEVTEQNRYYQSSLDKMICLTPNKPINDNLNAMPIYQIQDLSKMPNGFPKSEMITIK